MQNIIRILHLEDREADSILIKSEISKGFESFEYFFVDNESDFRNILKEKNIDIILSDYVLPDYSGSDALHFIKSKYPHIPFIFVSGVMGEDAAIASMLNGAVDYVLKTKLKRLVPAINRALHESALLREQKLADTERRKLYRAVEQSSVSVIITDVDGKVEYVNPKVCETTGYTREELIGQNPRIFKSGEVPTSDYKKIWDVIISGKQWHGEFHNKKKSGELYWEAASISPVFDANGSITHYVAIKEDITRQKALIVELKEAKEKAEAGDRLKMAFIQNISHEIRTPLSGILGFAEFVLEPDITEEEKKVYRDVLSTSSERLLNTITNYMDISLIVSGNMVFRPKTVNLTIMMNAIYERFLPKCRAKNLEFNIQLPPDRNTYSLTSDASLLTKAISHLLDNAIKFTKTGNITMGFRISDGDYEIFVRDTGSGIASESQLKVFQIFMQEEASDSREYEGSGLGLSICKGLVDLIGGKIRIESSKGMGTTIFITLRSENQVVYKNEYTEKSENSEKSEIKIQESDMKKNPVILVAEDNDFNSSFYKIILERASFKFLQAKNGAEAVEMCHSHPEISLVLMDIKMPLMDGFEATRKIRQFRRNLPIISVSALATFDDKEKALQAGCNEYLIKPVNIGPLLKIINDYVNN